MNFAPKPAAAKAPASKGGPQTSAPLEPEIEVKTPFQELIDSGQEFILGPPPGINKTYNAHRNAVLPKLAPNIDVYAKKLREYYFREGVLHEQKTYIDALRVRQPEDTLEVLMQKKEIPAIIEGRDEFEDIDLVFPWRIPHQITRSEHSYVRPWYVKYKKDNEEHEVRVTVNEVKHHYSRGYPYYMNLQRYIVGRPNLLLMPIYPVQEDKSLHYQAGCRFNFLVRELYVWCFLDKYPARLEVDCRYLTPKFSVKIGDVEKMLPHGMYLHKQYDYRKFQSVAKLDTSNLYMQRKNALLEQDDAIQEQKRKIQLQLMNEQKLEKKDGREKKKTEKHVPSVVQSSKFIMQEKKDFEKAAEKAGKEEKKEK